MVKPGQRVWSGAALRDLLNEPRTDARVSNYFDRSAGPHAGFTGAWFEHLGRELVRPDDRVTAHDLLAVQALGVRVPAAATIALLDTSLGDALGELLAQVPRNLDLADEQAADATASGSAASQAWQLLRHRAKIGRVTTAKLLARQRPRLLPVWDSVVDCALGWNMLGTGQYWTKLRDELREDDCALQGQLVDALDRLAMSGRVSPLRLFDVEVWTRHQQAHRAAGKLCTGMQK